jgi:tetratricopeptide (TPR) repeat protein
MSVRQRKKTRASVCKRSSDSVRPAWWILPSILAVTALVYVRTLSYEFVYDDLEQILRNQHIQSWKYLPTYFTSHVWSQLDVKGTYYRPAFLLWLRVNWALFGSSAWGWHATTVAVHVAATALLYFFVRKLSRDETVAAIAALLFGLHPVHIESVAWVSGVTDPLAAISCLGALLCYMRWQETPEKKWFFAALTLYFAALLSKEPTILALLLFVLLDWLKYRDWSFARRSVPFVTLTLIFVGMRYHALGGLGPKCYSMNLLQLFVSGTSVCWHYIRVMLLPFPISPFYDFQFPIAATARGFFPPLMALLVVAALVTFFVKRLDPGPRRNAAYIALIWILVPTFLALQLNRLEFVQDRYMYLPSIGMSILVAVALRQFVTMKVARNAAVAIAVCYGTLTIAQQGVWSDEVALFSVFAQKAPEVNKFTDWLANALMAHKRCPEAIPLFEQVVAKDPSRWNAYANIGNCYIREGNLAEGILYLERAAAVNQDPVLMRQLEFMRQVQQQRTQAWPGDPGS